MAGAADERPPGPPAEEQLQQQHVACQVLPERLAEGKPGQGFLSSFFTNNQKCQLMLLKTLETSRSRGPGAGGRLGVGPDGVRDRREGSLGSAPWAEFRHLCVGSR